MRTYIIKFRAELENCTRLQPVDTDSYPHDYRIGYECLRCSAKHPKTVCITQADRQEVVGLRRVAHYHSRCHSCKNSIYFILKRTKESIGLEASGKFVPLVEVHLHGGIVNEFELSDQFECESTSGIIFDQIDLRGGEWAEFDEKAGVPISITDFEWQIESLRVNSQITTL